LGFLVWIEDCGDELPNEHAIAVNFFRSQNPEAFDVLQRSGRQVHMGVVKLNLSGEEFTQSALKAAMEQAKKLETCALVVQHGAIEVSWTPHKYNYVLCSFFQAHKTAVLIPQPFTSIELV